MEISYDHFTEAKPLMRATVRSLCLREDVVRVCDVGGGAKPLLTPQEVGAHELRYALLDVSHHELAKAPDTYAKIEADAAADDFSVDGTFDLVFSHWVAEHVASAEKFHRNIAGMLRPGGWAVHLFPTLFSTPFVVNRLLSRRLATRTLAFVRSKRRKSFPAFYDWCRGPIPRQFERFRSLGYEIESYRGFFGHAYWGRFPRLDTLESRLTRRLVARPNPWLTSYALVVLRSL